MEAKTLTLEGTAGREKAFEFVAVKRVSKSKSSLKTLWRTFWIGQTVGLASLFATELVSNAFPQIVPHLKFLGFGLLFVGLECAFLAKLKENRPIEHGEEETQSTAEF